eukprot:4630161-Alexandrium_andersonii.AAC.1
MCIRDSPGPRSPGFTELAATRLQAHARAEACGRLLAGFRPDRQEQAGGSSAGSSSHFARPRIHGPFPGPQRCPLFRRAARAGACGNAA